MPNYAKEDYTPEEIRLWEAIRQHEGEPLSTVKGLTFTYRIRGNELLVDRKSRLSSCDCKYGEADRTKAARNLRRKLSVPAFL